MAIGGFVPGIFSGIDATFIFWVIAFLILLGITNFALTKFFKKQKMVGTVIAILVSIAIVYFTSRKYPGLLNSFSYGLGIDPDFLLNIFPWIGLGIAIIVIVIWGIGMLLMIIGLGLIASGVTGLAYEKAAAIIIGIALFLIGLWLWYRRKRKKKGIKKEKNPKNPKNPKENVYLKIQVAGNGRTNPHPGTYTMKKGERVKIYASPHNSLDYWTINGVKYGKSPSIKLKMNINYSIVAVFGNAPPEKKIPRIDILIKEAKEFRNWTKTQSNPRFYQNWAHYLSWLKRKGYGGSEAEIVNNLNVARKDVIHVVRRHVL